MYCIMYKVYNVSAMLRWFREFFFKFVQFYHFASMCDIFFPWYLPVCFLTAWDRMTHLCFILCKH